MDNSTFQTNLNTLKEIILDEERLVTYVSLSKELCIHVNDSKSLMSNVVGEIKEKQPDIDLNVCYIISGLSGDNKARTTVCSEKEVGDLRKSLCSVFFEHIYSVCKGRSVGNNIAYLSLNTFEDFPLCTGLIKSVACGKRTSEEIGTLKCSSKIVVEEPKPIVALKQTKVNSKEAKIIGQKENDRSVLKLEETKSEPIFKTELLSPKQDFSNKQKLSDNKRNGLKTQKGIAGFFSKSVSAPGKPVGNIKAEKTSVNVKTDIVEEKVDLQSQPQPKEVKVEKMDVDDQTDFKSLCTTEIKKCKPSEAKETKKKSINKLNTSLNKIKKNAKVDKKRKRVLHVSDSESDEDNNDPFVEEPVANYESEDEIPATPTVNTVKITSGIVNPKKRRKIIDKTYMDEDGYVMTKKEEVYESCSDNEDTSVKENMEVQGKAKPVKQDDSPKGKKDAPKSKKKVSPPQKGKQPTMMSFFKKT